MFTFHVEPAARAHGGVMPECCNTTAVSPAERAALSAIERVLKFPHERRCDAETLRQSERPVIGNSRSRVVWRLLAVFRRMAEGGRFIENRASGTYTSGRRSLPS